jgi:hypothetical protein
LIKSRGRGNFAKKKSVITTKPQMNCSSEESNCVIRLSRNSTPSVLSATTALLNSLLRQQQ